MHVTLIERENIMMNLKTGDLIKSYDFGKEVRSDCYMVGRVRSVNNNVISCDYVKGFFADKVVIPEQNELFSTLIQGASLMDDTWTRIEMIATAEEVALVLSDYNTSH
jgi:hypothetical protein